MAKSVNRRSSSLVQRESARDLDIDIATKVNNGPGPNMLFRFSNYVLDEEKRNKRSLVAGLVVTALHLVEIGFPPLRCHGNVTHEPEYSHQFQGDTVSTVMVLSISFIPPLIELIAAEWVLNKKVVNPYDYNSEDTRWQRTRFFAFRWYRDYICGLAFMLLLVEAGKLTVGAPRPHWVSMCNVSFPSQNCVLGWVSNYTCLNTDKKFSKYRLLDGRKSFPSGHAALSFYAGLFMIMYQHFRFNRKKLGPVILLLLHCVWFSWAIVCALSRVSDFRHHYRDIAFGSLLGVIAASFSGLHLCQKFTKSFKYDSSKTKIVTGLNGNAGILEGFGPNGGVTQLHTVVTAGGNGNNQTPNGGTHLSNGAKPKGPSLRKLLSNRSSLPAEASESRETEDL